MAEISEQSVTKTSTLAKLVFGPHGQDPLRTAVLRHLTYNDVRNLRQTNQAIRRDEVLQQLMQDPDKGGWLIPCCMWPTHATREIPRFIANLGVAPFPLRSLYKLHPNQHNCEMRPQSFFKSHQRSAGCPHTQNSEVARRVWWKSQWLLDRYDTPGKIAECKQHSTMMPGGPTKFYVCGFHHYAWAQYTPFREVSGPGTSSDFEQKERFLRRLLQIRPLPRRRPQLHLQRPAFL